MPLAIDFSPLFIFVDFSHDGWLDFHHLIFSFDVAVPHSPPFELRFDFFSLHHKLFRFTLFVTFPFFQLFNISQLLAYSCQLC